MRIDIPLKFNDVFHEGDRVIFITDEDFFGLKGQGKIRWISMDRNEAGIEFAELYNDSRKVFEEFLRICS